VLAAGLAGAPSAAAQGAVFSITPVNQQPYFVFKGVPGRTLHGAVRVVNDSSVAGRVSLYAVDATTGQTSGAVYLSPGARRRDVGRWVRLSAHSLWLAAHGSRTVSFVVSVPRGSPGGQHLGGLVAAPIEARETQTRRAGKRAFQVKIRQIAIVAVQVSLPGAAVQRMGIRSLAASGQPRYQTLLVGLANTGNTLVKGAGRLTISGHGRRVLDSAFALDRFVPRTHVAFPVYVRGKRVPPGRYVAVVSIRYGHGHTLRRVFGLTISAGQVRRTYGTNAASLGGGQPGNAAPPGWALGLGALALVGVSVGGSSLYFRRRSAA
jgi:hypothetical protein